MHTHTQYTHTTRTHEHTHTNTQTHIRARTHTHTHTHMRAQDCVFAVFAQFLRDVGARPHATLELTLPLKAASMPLAACLPNALSTPEKKRLFSRARRAAARACARARIIRALCQRSHPRCRMTQAHGTCGTQHAGCMSGGSAHTRDPVHAGRQGTSIFWRFFSQLGCEADEDEESDQCPYQPVLPWPLPLDSMLVSSSLLSSLLSWSLENCDMSESESRSCTSSLLAAPPVLAAAITRSAIAMAATPTRPTARNRTGLPAGDAAAGSGIGTAAP